MHLSARGTARPKFPEDDIPKNGDKGLPTLEGVEITAVVDVESSSDLGRSGACCSSPHIN